MGGFLGVLLGGASQVSVVMSPGDSYQSTSLASATTFNESIGVSGGVASSYVWGIVNTSGGTWALQSGQGTANAVFSCAALPPGGIAICNIKCDVTVNGNVYQVVANLEYDRL